MPSPKSGSPGSPVSPASPKDALEADKADPGEVEAIKAQAKKTGSGSSGQSPSKPYKPDPEKKSWIEIVLVDEAGDPVTGESYSITLPDGETVAEGTLDEKGLARVDGIDPGSCKVTFPNLDKDAWKPK